MAATRELLPVLSRVVARPAIQTRGATAVAWHVASRHICTPARSAPAVFRAWTAATLRSAAPLRTTGAVGRRTYSTEPEQTNTWNFEEVEKLVAELKYNTNQPGKKPSPKRVIVDTREPVELQQTGRIPTAINIPLVSEPDSYHISEDDFQVRYGFDRPAHDTELVMYCKAGVRAANAAALARNAGWKVVGVYRGSWLDWTAKNGLVEK